MAEVKNISSLSKIADNASGNKQLLLLDRDELKRLPLSNVLVYHGRKTDFNEMTERGYYDVGSSSENGPDGLSTWCFVEVLTFGGGDIIQRVTNITPPYRQFVRAGNIRDSTWKSWQKSWGGGG